MGQRISIQYSIDIDDLENEVESSKSEDQAQSLANIEKELNNIITKEE